MGENENSKDFRQELFVVKVRKKMIRMFFGVPWGITNGEILHDKKRVGESNMKLQPN